MNEPTQIDWARLAAYIDGEGCISIISTKTHNRQKTRPYHLLIAVYNCDPRLLVWCKETFKMGHIATHLKKGHPSHRPSYKWMASDGKAEMLLVGCSIATIEYREQLKGQLSELKRKEIPVGLVS